MPQRLHTMRGSSKCRVACADRTVDPDYKGKGLQLEFTVEDEGVFTMPWKGIVTYRHALRRFWDERICAENITNYEGRNYYSDNDAKPPRADKPDF
jgi:hypothetical protein